MASAAAAMMNRHIVSTILHHLSDMKYKDRRQYGPDQPVEFLEFRPTLVPAILVNWLWADEGTGILWRRYPHLPALRGMARDRRQYYANKVHRIFAMSPPDGSEDVLEYLEGLVWPSLKNLEFEVDFVRHGSKFASMLHGGLEHLELSGVQSEDSRYFFETILSMVFASCTNLKSIRIGPGSITEDDPIHVSALFDHLDSVPSIDTVEVKATNFIDKDALFARLSQRSGLEGLEIDLDPGFALLPLLSGPNALPSPFASLKRLAVMCYPEIALTLPIHLRLIEDLQLDIARIPDQPFQHSDQAILEILVDQVSHCGNLRLLKVGVGVLAEDFPSFSSFPTLSGGRLVKLARSCPKLEDINLFSIEPSAIDGSGILPEQFDEFCSILPELRSLNLKLHPPTVSSLSTTALQSLGTHCPILEVLRLKLSFQLPSLQVPNTIPQILINGEGTPGPLTLEDGAVLVNTKLVEPHTPGTSTTSSGYTDLASPTLSASSSYVAPLFPKLTHLAIARPGSALYTTIGDTFTISSNSYASSDVAVDPDLEEDLVRSWAHPLLNHFPRLEILEAWGDHVGQDNESLNYFLPKEEILASTWEFLSGVEQDLWEGDEDEDVGVNNRASWQTLESDDLEDWDKASLMNEFVVADCGLGAAIELGMGRLAVFEEEPEGTITPRRAFEGEGRLSRRLIF